MGEEDTELLNALFKAAILKGVPYEKQIALFNDHSRYKIVNKSRKIGITTIVALKALVYALSGELSIIVSPSARQSRMVVTDYIERYIRAYPNSEMPPAKRLPRLIEDSKTVKRFENGGAVMSLPNSASTIRGLTPAYIVIDEAALFLDGTDREVWEAVLPMMKQAHELDMISTPFGEQNIFFEEWIGKRPWSKHLINYRDCPFGRETVEADRMMYDDITWDQEFENTFRGEVASEFPRKLVEACIDSNMDYETNARGDVAGWDVGRRRDLSCICIVRKENGIKRLVEKHIWAGVPFEEQQARALEIAKRVGVMNVDQGGMGEAPAEWLKSRSPNVEPIFFSDVLKTEMFLGLKRDFEQRKIQLPLDVRMVQSLGMIHRYYKLGRVIIDAERTDELGHADEATALALACWFDTTRETTAAGMWPCEVCNGQEPAKSRCHACGGSGFHMFNF